MDKALDDVIGERQRSGRSGRRGGRRDNWSNEQPRKSRREDKQGIDDDWLHDRFDDERGDIRGGSRYRDRRQQRRSPEQDRFDEGVKLRIENLHYDLTEDDLEGLFSGIDPIVSLTLTYDRSGRSTGTAYVTYRSMAPAREAIKEFDGANANGQPIRLSIVPTAPSRRSLFERVEEGRKNVGGGGSRGPPRERSRSPRRSDVSKPAPGGIDRYIPGGSRSRSPPPRRRRGGGGGNGGGDSRRNDSRRGGRRGERTGEGAPRPKKTQEQLDREMEDYWNKRSDGAGNVANGGEPAPTAATPAAVGGEDMEIEMAE